MKVAILALAVLAVVGANPAARQPWHWISPLPQFTPNVKAMPLQDYVQFAAPPHKRISPRFGKAVPGCGVPGAFDTETRIVGGTEATPHAYPWQVALYIDSRYFCGGSLISDEWVMTAGHCTTGSQSIEVVMGAHNRLVNEATQVTMVSTNIITHENYGPIFIKNDIGLVRLPSPVALTSAINPICLPAFSDADVGVDVILQTSGWGITSDGGSQPANLMTTNVPSIANVDCEAVYGTNVVTADVLCVATTGGIGTCSGDSGGPLTLSPGGTYVSRGITSFGASAGCEVGYPAGFTRTKYFLDWIQTNTGILIDP